MALGCPAPCFSRAPAISRGSPVPRSTLLPPTAPPFSLSLKFSARIELLRDGCHGVHQRSRPAHVLHAEFLLLQPVATAPFAWPRLPLLGPLSACSLFLAALSFSAPPAVPCALSSVG
ncbi:hypothetical protein ZEAMMB73_Zm00001d015587 [Zea mays]|uniref:Uncharacterized protein n=1 Tax=Zea mays TaxID=4577 RepID=A0A1D6H2T8_MAIZE|nr:hypothetical protein ZEAMMB73_Zm00001d015587 [Zea mays]